MANNPYVNKVIYDGTTLMDITDTTAEASDVAEGKYFYKADGSKTLGTASAGVKDVTVSGTSVVNAQGVAELNSNFKVFNLSSGETGDTPSTYAEIREAYDYWEQNLDSTLIFIEGIIVTFAYDYEGDENYIIFNIGTLIIDDYNNNISAYKCDYTNTSTAQLEYVYIDVQPLLESGVNIKKINNQSLLGSGNITVGGDTNVIETVKVNNTPLTPDANKSVNIDLSSYATQTWVQNYIASLDANNTSY